MRKTFAQVCQQEQEHDNIGLVPNFNLNQTQCGKIRECVMDVKDKVTCIGSLSW